AAFIEPVLVVRRVLREQLAVLHSRILTIARDNATAKRLMTIPGVGPIVALSYFATVDVPARFTNSKAAGAAFGLTPSQYQSGEIMRTGRISLCGDRMMRALLYEAAQVMLFRSQKWSWLKAWAMKIVKNRGAKKGIVALARRLAVVMHRMWMDGTDFRYGREGSAPAA
ncbi:MAG: transposase, partial [Bauldia litoralis]|uniref:transposase n=2 Tax=Alphaproteobacteria TaxID=28211 RepID=UPI0032995260